MEGKNVPKLTGYPVLSLLVIVTGIVAVLPYLPSLYADFVWDDTVLIKHNPHLEAPDHVRRLWFSDFFDLTTDSSGSNFWRPLVRFSMWLDYKMHGLSPEGFHLTNLILFGLMTAVVFLFFNHLLKTESTGTGHGRVTRIPDSGMQRFHLRRFGTYPAAVAASLLFAWHPLRTEIAVWISGRTETMVLLFGIAALHGFFISIDKDTVSRFTLAIACCLLGLSLLSKESAILFPLLALMIRYQRINRHRWAFLAFCFPVAAWAVLRYISIGMNKWFHQPSESLYLPAAAGRSFMHYLAIHIWPVGLSSDPWFPLPETYADPYVLAGLLLLMAIPVLYAFHKNLITKGMLWFVLTLTPFLNVLPMPRRAADRYTTLASIGFVMVLAGIWQRLRSRSLRCLYLAAIIPVLVTWVAIVRILVPTWFTDRDVMSRAARYGQSPQALFYRGNEAFGHNNFQEAYDAYKLAYERSDIHTAVQLYNFALAELELEKIDDAITHLERVVELDPEHKKAGTMLGELYMRTGHYRKSIQIMTSQARIHPENPVPHLIMGIIHMDFLDQPVEAEKCLKVASQRDALNQYASEIYRRLKQLESR